MSMFREAVAEWNKRHKAGETPEECPKCGQPRGVKLEVIGQQTRAACDICAFLWLVT